MNSKFKGLLIVVISAVIGFYFPVLAPILSQVPQSAFGG